MIVVVDTGPFNYLILIGVAEVLQSLFEPVVIPYAVAAELSAPKTPLMVRTWFPARLDPGERAAIALAGSLFAPRVLIDDLDGRAEAERWRLKVTQRLAFSPTRIAKV